jgi:hypothetical protein
VRRPLPPELIALGDHLETAARRAVGARRTRRQMVLNAITSMVIAIPLVATAVDAATTPAATPVVAPAASNASPSLGRKADDIPPRLLARGSNPNEDVLVEPTTLRRALR